MSIESALSYVVKQGVFERLLGPKPVEKRPDDTHGRRDTKQRQTEWKNGWKVRPFKVLFLSKWCFVQRLLRFDSYSCCRMERSGTGEDTRGGATTMMTSRGSGARCVWTGKAVGASGVTPATSSTGDR